MGPHSRCNRVPWTWALGNIYARQPLQVPCQQRCLRDPTSLCKRITVDTGYGHILQGVPLRVSTGHAWTVSNAVRFAKAQPPLNSACSIKNANAKDNPSKMSSYALVLVQDTQTNNVMWVSIMECIPECRLCGWAKNRTIFKFLIRVYVDTESRPTAVFFTRSKTGLQMLRHLNVLCTRSAKRHYHCVIYRLTTNTLAFYLFIYLLVNRAQNTKNEPC